jgi:conjugal transfer pilus assembly protein TraE
VASLATNVLTAAALATKSNTHRQTLVPPEISKTFWVEDRNVSAEYLEQMALFALQLALNNTPSSAEFNARQLLKYVAPASYGEIEKTLLAGARAEGQQLVDDVRCHADPAIAGRNAISVTGLQATWIGDKRVPDPQDLPVAVHLFGRTLYIRDIRR